MRQMEMGLSAPNDELISLALELAGSLDARTVMRRILDRSLTVASACERQLGLERHDP